MLTSNKEKLSYFDTFGDICILALTITNILRGTSNDKNVPITGRNSFFIIPIFAISSFAIVEKITLGDGEDMQELCRS